MISPEWNRRLTRRNVLRIGGSLVTLGVVSYVFGRRVDDAIISPHFPSAPEAQDLEPQLALLGAIAVYEGANIRTSPTIPDRTRFRKPDNTIDWQEIETINEVPLADAKVFVIVNTPVVYGQSVSNSFLDDKSNYFYKNPTFYGYKSWWIKLSIKKRRQDQSIPGYFNYSDQTREFVVPLEYITAAERRNRQSYSTTTRTIHENDLGKIFVPKNPETVAQEIMPGLWAVDVRAKLDGKIPIYSSINSIPTGEKIFKDLQVVAAGDSWDELVKMKEAGTPVNVRDYPGKYYLNGEPTKILGLVNQGTRIKSVLESGGFDAFKFADLEGPLLDQKGDRVNLPPDKICAIWSSYLA